MKKEKLSIIIPVFNEEKTISELLKKVAKVKLGIEKEVIIVNDGSKDSSLEKIKSFAEKNKNTIIISKKNNGKGSAVVAGLAKASGTIMLIQDADLEYNPKEIGKILSPILEGKTSVVFGSRFKGKTTGKKLISHFIGNKILSLATKIIFMQDISDMETGYKAFRKEVLDGIEIKAKRFDFEPEITAKIIKKGYKIIEIPITYNARGHEEGKKIGIKDGFIALKTIIKYRFSN